MSTKFGLLIDFDFPKTAASTSRKQEVVLSDCFRHVAKSKARQISAVSGPIWIKFGSLMQNGMLITVI